VVPQASGQRPAKRRPCRARRYNSSGTWHSWSSNRTPVYQSASSLVALEEFAEERCRFIRDADDLVRRLTIEFEIKLGLGLTVYVDKTSSAKPQLPDQIEGVRVKVVLTDPFIAF
jgi:hypothetical protein